MGIESLSTHFNYSGFQTKTDPIAFPLSNSPAPPVISRDQVEKTNANAAQLGLYTLDQIQKKGLKILELKDFAPISQGSYQSGQYSSRVLYLENGKTPQFLGGDLAGRFIVNQNYRVQGEPSGSNENSTRGQFPVNGQYFLQGHYQSPKPELPNPLLNGQYATSHQDEINQQFTPTGIIQATGNLLKGGPFYISQSDLLNGQYQLHIQNLQGSPLLVNGQNTSSISERSQQGQLLVNGTNSVPGIIRPLNQFTQTVTLLIHGNYSDDGKYTINGITLENGSNAITTRYATSTIQGTAPAILEGRYTSGGQFVVNDTNGSENPTLAPSSSLIFEKLQKRIQQAFTVYGKPQPGKILKLKG